jgi:solute carrier family 13 (sodium-dependent dicarboxylate transporter), member 2/3/5
MGGMGQRRSSFPARWMLTGAAIAAIAVFSLTAVDDPLMGRALLIAGVCLTLWLSETVPPYVPTFLLWAVTPLLLAPFGGAFRPGPVLRWSADPVLALFLGGFTLSVAASRYGLDARVAELAVRLSRNSRPALLALTAAATALLSMWMSNIAAAAMMIAALRPAMGHMPKEDPFRRALLVGLALGANFGGMATPVGTGPNAIAIAAASRHQPVTFLEWMAFALPLTLGMLAAGVLLLVLRFRVRGAAGLPDVKPQPLDRQARAVLIVFLATAAAWLAEPLHGAPAASVSLLSTAVLFGSKLLERADLDAIDWSTLALIAGGIGLGNLLEQSGLVKAAAAAIPWTELPGFARLLTLCLASALLSALMSNTAAATMLIPLAGSLDPSPSTAILIAIAASMGIPFVISTPPNAMVYGEGGVKTSDLLAPGLVLMIAGCILVSLTGPWMLKLVGIP